ncbi:MAG TPA: molybdopterin cofactor-binding domain-containing protein, partial [Burkholderiales bacterium]|nr:molybdopterin cofactor-binding domain-containing protein [Burkholderiales bacterium]
MLTEQFSRRDFLKGSGALVVTFTLGAPLAHAATRGEASPVKTVAADEVAGFLAIDSRGRATVYSGKVDLGTGVYTALTQIAAEELYLPLEKVELIQGDTALTPDQGTTWGSLSIQIGGMQIRQACATAREALVDMAAQKLGVARTALYVKDGEVRRLGSEQGIAYGALVAKQQFTMKVDAKAPTKNPALYTVVGTPVRRLDIPDKVMARFEYMQDFRRKGMVHARVVRPAGIKSQLVSFDDTASKKIPGYLATVRKGSFLAVVARNEWAAIRSADAMKAQWSDWQGLPERSQLWQHVRATKVNKEEVLQNVGNVAEGLKGGAKTLSATYDFAVHTHGSIGPSCAVAETSQGKLTVWTASQATHGLRKQLAKMLSLKPEEVRCIYVEGAGCY